MENIRISIVIPVYNTKEFLERCVRSIIQQDFKEYEVILVDDGSTDGSGQFCDVLAEKHELIRVIHKENEGVNYARRTGVREAYGEWISFVDSDDLLEPNALQNLFSVSKDTDIVIGFFTKPPKPFAMTLEEAKHAVITGRGITPSPFAKLIKKELLTDSIFDFPPKLCFGEDMIMNIKLMFSTTKAPHFVFKKVYNYVRNGSSVSHQRDKRLDYEQFFDDCRSSIIPKGDLDIYMNDILWIRLMGFCTLALSDTSTLAEKKHPFIERTKADIQRVGYQLNFREKIIMKSHSKKLIRLLGYILIVKNGLLYRLKDYNII